MDVSIFFPVKGTYCHKIIRYIRSILETYFVKAEHRKLHEEHGRGSFTITAKKKNRKQLKLTRKSLAFQKKGLRNRESSLQESEVYKLFTEAKSSLLEVPGEN